MRKHVYVIFISFTDTPNTSRSEYYKGDCLEVEESQGSSRPYVTGNPGHLGLGSTRPESSRPGQLGRVSSASALYTGQVDRCHVHVGVRIDRRYEYVEK